MFVMPGVAWAEGIRERDVKVEGSGEYKGQEVGGSSCRERA